MTKRLEERVKRLEEFVEAIKTACQPKLEYKLWYSIAEPKTKPKRTRKKGTRP